MGDSVNFLANDDLSLELHNGGNISAGWGSHSDHVLVLINVDDCEYSNVQVSARYSETYLAAIEASIEALVVIRDQLSNMTGAGACRCGAAVCDDPCSVFPLAVCPPYGLSGDTSPHGTTTPASMREAGTAVKSLSHQFAKAVRRHRLLWSTDARGHSPRRVPIPSRWSLRGLRVGSCRSGGQRTEGP